ncbi:plasmid stabilization protein [Allostella sp. ATCC 35155]|nr:plasmid stabilization protein [Stella sp. ATCC 35155]
MRRLAVTEPAGRDLAQLVDHIATDNPAAAERVFRAIDAAMQRLRRFPNLGRRGRLPGTRELPVPALPYLLVYENDIDSVIILAVLHGARDVDRLLLARSSELDR